MQKNMQKYFKIALILIAISSFTACYYDKKDQVYPQVVVAACDTTNVSYSVTVTNILNANCNNCHGASANSLGAGIVLNTYATVKPYITNGRLVNSILQNGNASPMPKNMAKMDICSINKIIVWANRGAINN
jgi:mono/diheme cytochrome c family protein